MTVGESAPVSSSERFSSDLRAEIVQASEELLATQARRDDSMYELLGAELEMAIASGDDETASAIRDQLDNFPVQ